MSGYRVVLGISGASGAGIGVRVAELLRTLGNAEVHLVVSSAGEQTLAHEVGSDALQRLEESVACRHDVRDIGAPIASGSFATAGMIVAPCSMRSLCCIATGIGDNLLTRAADVHLKERRRLVLVARESPLHLGHLRSMIAATECGAIVAPAIPSFYLAPHSATDIIDQIARRTIDVLGLEATRFSSQWVGLQRTGGRSGD
jgi:4-hydroxy-3-polyprenylbenzoate decarboxylase